MDEVLAFVCGILVAALLLVVFVICYYFGCYDFGKRSRKCRRRGRFGYKVGEPYSPEEKPMPLELTIKLGKAIDVTAVPQTDHVPPRPVELDGPATWSVLAGAGTLGTVLQGGESLPADGLRQSLLASTTELGDTLYQIQGDAAPGEPVRHIVDTVLVHVVAREAATFGLAAGGEYEPAP
jgi:hypothetical protein